MLAEGAGWGGGHLREVSHSRDLTCCEDHSWGEMRPREEKGLTSFECHPTPLTPNPCAFHPLGKDTTLAFSLTFGLTALPLT